jgi:hypothetical protein
MSNSSDSGVVVSPSKEDEDRETKEKIGKMEVKKQNQWR